MSIYTHLLSRVSTHRYLAVSILFSLGLVGWRIFYTGHITYIFLVWNLILAFIPFAISELAFQASKKITAPANIIGILCCIAFLPNSPYIVTDLFHLRWHSQPSIWYDTVLIVSFAWNGMLLFFHTLINMDEKLFKEWSRPKAWLLKLCIMGLSGFGIYLGRYLRFNSWDVISDPWPLVYEIGDRIIHPFQHPLTWSMTLVYAFFLAFTYLTFLEANAKKAVKLPVK